MKIDKIDQIGEVLLLNRILKKQPTKIMRVSMTA